MCEQLLKQRAIGSVKINVGVEYPLPRAPQVFPVKVKHRGLDDTEFNPIADSCVSGQLSSKELEAKFREELLGRMEPSKLSVLKAKYGNKLRPLHPL